MRPDPGFFANPKPVLPIVPARACARLLHLIKVPELIRGGAHYVAEEKPLAMAELIERYAAESLAPESR